MTLLWFGPLRDLRGRASEQLVLERSTTLAELYRLMVQAPRLPVAYAKNGRMVEGDALAEPGDELVFLPPVGGG